MALGIAAGGRRINLRGCFNVRDIGGCRTGDGTSTHWRSLFRSDGLHLLTSADRRDLAALGLSSVVDLRTPAEVAVQGAVPAVAATVHQLPLGKVLPDHAGHPCAAEPARIAEAYGATLAAGVETVREILAILTDPSSYPAVICCPTGTDRTGVVSALILAIIGVPDYLAITTSPPAGRRPSGVPANRASALRHPGHVGSGWCSFGPTCPACAGPTRTAALCPECSEAFAVARRAHPRATGALPVPPVDDDLDMWDAWSVLGDVGGRA